MYNFAAEIDSTGMYRNLPALEKSCCTNNGAEIAVREGEIVQSSSVRLTAAPRSSRGASSELLVALRSRTTAEGTL